MADHPGPEMVDKMMAILKRINETDEFFQTVASMMKKLHGALVKAGFTEEQATQIVAGFAAKGRK